MTAARRCFPSTLGIALIACAASWPFGWSVACPAAAQEAKAGAAAANPFEPAPKPAENPFEAAPKPAPPIADPFAPDFQDLVREIVPDDAPARPPYQFARYDPGLKPKPGEPDRDMAALRKEAVERQDRLEWWWRQFKTSPHKPTTPGRAAEWKLVQYAFGEGPLEEALAAAREAGPDHRMRLARLLLAECRFGPAVRELAALAGLPAEEGEPASVPERALALLVAHQVQREELARHVPLVPLDFDLEGYLARRGEDSYTRLLIEGLRRAARGSARVRAVETAALPEIEVLEIDDPEAILDAEPPDAHAVEVLAGLARGEGPTLAGAGDAWLVADGHDLVLYREGRGWISGGRAEITLHSAFGGPLRLRLYRFASAEECGQVTAAKLASLKPERSWNETFVALRENNRAEPYERKIVVQDLAEGHYLLTAEARYAPMAAACKFCVNNVALYLRAGPNRGVAVAVDRRDGRPLPGVPVEIVLSGTPDIDKVALGVPRADDRAFRRGFAGDASAEEGQPPTDDPAEQIRRAKAYAAGMASYALGRSMRRRFPDFKHVLDLRTGPDGSIGFPLEDALPGYQVLLAASRTADSLGAAFASRAEVGRPADEKIRGARKVVVWLAQPIHRPGSTVQFAGILRSLPDARQATSDREATREVRVKAHNYYRRETLWEGTCPVSAAGTFHGGFRVPAGAGLGPVTFYVDGLAAEPRAPLVVAEYRLPTYSVELTLAQEKFAGAQDVRGAVLVKYLTGKPASGAEVELVLEDGRPEPPSQVALTDGAGRAEFSLPLPPLEQDRIFELRATVMDASGQTYTQSRKVDCTANDFQVVIVPAVLEATYGQAIDVKVRAAAWAGQPIRGATVILDGSRQGATTDQAGVATLRVVMPAGSNMHQIRAAVMAGGRVVRAVSDTIRLRAKVEDATPQTRAPAAQAARFEISAWDCPARIDAGDPLEFSVTLSGPSGRCATLAAFIENNRLLGWQVLHAAPGGHRFRFPTEREWAPTVQLAVAVLDGQSQRTVTRSVYLRPVHRLLTLSVETDKAEYKPGESCAAVVTATDHEGRPVGGAEISLGVVDEAVYLAIEDPTPDLLDFFHKHELPYLCREGYDSAAPPAESLWYWLGPQRGWGYYTMETAFWQGRGAGRRMLAAYGGMAAAGRMPQPLVRRNFETAAHWVAQLATDAQGKARASFRLPDSVTRWRFTARGVTPDTLVGEVRAVRRTFLPLGVELALPRALRVGDRIDLPVVLHNNSDQPRTVQVEARSAQHKTPPQVRSRSEGLAPNGDGRLTVPVTAADTRPVTVFASARDTQRGDADAVEKKLSPLPRGIRVVRSYSGLLSKTAVIRPGLGPGLDQDGLVVSVRPEPGLAGVVESALDELIEYPYGCVEQTMSRFMPAVVAAEAMKKAGLRSRTADRLPDVLEKGLKRLAEFQHADGGWGWWQHDATNDFMTAYVLEGLALCRQSGQAVPEEMFARGRANLAERVRGGKLSGSRPHSVGDVSLPVYAAHALAIAYRADRGRQGSVSRELQSLLTSILEQGGRLDLSDKILLADAWRLLGDAERAKAALRALRSDASPRQGDRASVFAAAGLLGLGASLEPDDPHWPALAFRLVAARQGSGWGDTLTTSAAVRGLAPLVRPQRAKEAPIEVLVDGQKAGVLDTRGGAWLEARVARAEEITLRPARSGSGDFYCVQVQGWMKRPPPNPAAPEATLRVRLAALRPARSELAVGNSGAVTAPRGVTLEMEVEVDLRKPVSHARLTVPRPCGVELVRPPKPADGVVAIEERDDAMHFFIERWGPGRHRIALLVRAEVSGTVFAPPPELAPMYDDPPSAAVFAPTEWVITP